MPWLSYCDETSSFRDVPLESGDCRESPTAAVLVHVIALSPCGKDDPCLGRQCERSCRPLAGRVAALHLRRHHRHGTCVEGPSYLWMLREGH